MILNDKLLIGMHRDAWQADASPTLWAALETRMRKLIFLILITLFAAYAGWAERRPVGHYLSDLRSQVSVVQGQPGERGNLLAVQPELFTPDYQSAERLQLKFHAYLENARRQGLLNERTVVVFPEHVGTWLVASGESPRSMPPPTGPRRWTGWPRATR